jgi:hypothetical protein
MDPGIAHLQTFLATVSATFHFMNFVQVRALRGH